jgi:hypothetical protein
MGCWHSTVRGCHILALEYPDNAPRFLVDKYSDLYYDSTPLVETVKKVTEDENGTDPQPQQQHAQQQPPFQLQQPSMAPRHHTPMRERDYGMSNSHSHMGRDQSPHRHPGAPGGNYPPYPGSPAGMSMRGPPGGPGSYSGGGPPFNPSSSQFMGGDPMNSPRVGGGMGGMGLGGGGMGGGMSSGMGGGMPTGMGGGGMGTGMRPGIGGGMGGGMGVMGGGGMGGMGGGMVPGLGGGMSSGMGAGGGMAPGMGMGPGMSGMGQMGGGMTGGMGMVMDHGSNGMGMTMNMSPRGMRGISEDGFPIH